MLCHSPALCRQVLPLKQGEKAGEVLLIGRPANAMVRQGSTKVCMSIKNICPFSLAEGQSVSTSSVLKCLDLIAAFLDMWNAQLLVNRGEAHQMNNQKEKWTGLSDCLDL